jgi:hypothetical protein
LVSVYSGIKENSNYYMYSWKGKHKNKHKLTVFEENYSFSDILHHIVCISIIFHLKKKEEKETTIKEKEWRTNFN